jgi:hypothetical protein
VKEQLQNEKKEVVRKELRMLKMKGLKQMAILLHTYDFFLGFILLFCFFLFTSLFVFNCFIQGKA